MGDSINLMMAAAVFNFKKWMRKIENFFINLFINSKQYISESLGFVLANINYKMTF